MNVIITGSIAFDYLMSFPGRFVEHILPDQLDHLSVSFLVDEMRKQYGGTAPNIAYSLALLGERPRVMGTVGQDFGEYRAWLEQHGVDLSLIREEVDLFTSSCFVNTDLEGNQIVSFYAGAMARAHELSFRGMEADLVIVGATSPKAIIKYAAECQELGLPYLYDVSQQIIRLSGEELWAGLEGCDLLVVNEYEFGMLADKVGKEKTGLSDEAIRSAPARACIVTLGEKGARIWAKDGVYDVSAVPPKRLDDPTGVGDAFRAGLIKGLAMDLGWELAGQMGALAATYTLEQPGPQSHSYTLSEFVARFREHFDDEGALDALL
ncbi:MAG: carbohydrate kinase family protein [Anaerolineae bacterium]|jgi:adenosine kinase|nr:carbohydrate kinase family protein [Anaerolineae bacterium]